MTPRTLAPLGAVNAADAAGPSATITVEWVAARLAPVVVGLSPRSLRAVVTAAAYVPGTMPRTV